MNCRYSPPQHTPQWWTQSFKEGILCQDRSNLKLTNLDNIFLESIPNMFYFEANGCLQESPIKYIFVLSFRTLNSFLQIDKCPQDTLARKTASNPNNVSYALISILKSVPFLECHTSIGKCSLVKLKKMFLSAAFLLKFIYVFQTFWTQLSF